MTEKVPLLSPSRGILTNKQVPSSSKYLDLVLGNSEPTELL